MNISSFDIADMAISAMKEKSQNAEVKPGVLAHIRDDCIAIDSLCEENEANAIDAYVEQANGDFIIAIHAPLIEFMDGRSDPFFNIIKHTKYFTFSNDGDNAVIKLVYGGLFELE